MVSWVRPWHVLNTPLTTPRRSVKQSSHFLQAHALLNLHIIHSSQALERTTPPGAAAADPAAPTNNSTADTLHPALGPAGFKIYSPLTHPFAPGSIGGGGGVDGSSSSSGWNTPPDFGAMELLRVMSRLARAETTYIPYFHLCRELGVRAVDGMVKGRVLDLRWTEPVTREADDVRVRSGSGAGTGAGVGAMSPPPPQGAPLAPGLVGAGGTMQDIGPPPPIDDGDDMEAVSEAGAGMGMGPSAERVPDVFAEVMEVVGPKLVPTTPIMRYAMRDVVHEYEDDQSVSEYASLSDVDDY